MKKHRSFCSALTFPLSDIPTKFIHFTVILRTVGRTGKNIRLHFLDISVYIAAVLRKPIFRKPFHLAGKGFEIQLFQFPCNVFLIHGAAVSTVKEININDGTYPSTGVVIMLCGMCQKTFEKKKTSPEKFRLDEVMTVFEKLKFTDDEKREALYGG